MIIVTLKARDVPCHVNHHVLFPGRNITTSMAQIQIEDVHNECVIKALGQKRPGRNLGIKFLRQRPARECLARLEKLLNDLSDQSDSEAHPFTYFAVGQLILWAKNYPDAIFHVT